MHFNKPAHNVYTKLDYAGALMRMLLAVCLGACTDNLSTDLNSAKEPAATHRSNDVDQTLAHDQKDSEAKDGRDHHQQYDVAATTLWSPDRRIPGASQLDPLMGQSDAKVDFFLQKPCEQAGGNWQGDTAAQCICPEKQSFYLYGQEKKPFCMKINLDPVLAWIEVCKKNSTFDSSMNEPGLLAYLAEGTPSSSDRDGPFDDHAYKLEVPKHLSYCSPEVVAWLDAFVDNGYAKIPIWKKHKRFVAIHFKPLPWSQIDEQLLTELVRFDYPGSENELDEYVLPYGVIADTLDVNTSEMKQQDADWQTLQETIDSLRFQPTHGAWSVVANGRLAEEGYFSAQTEMIALENDNTLQGRREYCGGAICREYWILRNHATDPLVVVAFLPNQMPLYFFTFTYTVALPKVQITLDLYDKQGALMRSFPLEKNLELLLAQQKDFISSLVAAQNSPKLAVLDTMSVAHLSAKSLQAFLWGPFAMEPNRYHSDLRGSSLLGWHANPNGSFYHFMHPILAERFGVLREVGQSLPYLHGNDVLEAILDRDPSSKVLVLGQHHQQRAEQEQLFTHLPATVRVGVAPVNSRGHNLAYCQWANEDFFSRQGSSILWFIPVGDERMADCIPYLSSLANVVIVGSFYPPLPYQDFTEASPYIDILDKGAVRLSRDVVAGVVRNGYGATALAAAKAATTAATIWAKYPHYTMDQVKQAMQIRKSDPESRGLRMPIVDHQAMLNTPIQ